MNSILINNAYEGTLKHISLQIPRNKLTVFTGVSGSGKSTLLIDVLYNECQRQYLEAMSFQGIPKPKVDCIENVSGAIVITQNEANRNPRSTVGTLSDIYTGLRMIYEKLGERECPHCHKKINAANCKEETEKIRDEFNVYMYCHQCGHKMHKINRTDFSFNTKEGACPICDGLGEVLSIDQNIIADFNLSLEEGAIDFWKGKYKDYQMETLYQAYQYYGIPLPVNLPLNKYTEKQKAILFDGVESDLIKMEYPNIKPPKTAATGRFEGICATLKRRVANQNGELRTYAKYFTHTVCPECQGERLNETSRNVTVNEMRLPQLTSMTLNEVLTWIIALKESLTPSHYQLVKDYLLDIETKITRFANVGLSYLSLDRQTITLSKGELQRIKLAAVLDSQLTGMIYILDEPTAGLHPKDTKGLVSILKNLCDKGNTVLVIEHDPDVMKAADYLIDMGIGAGKQGGNIIASGTFKEVLQNSNSITAHYLNHPPVMKTNFRHSHEYLNVNNACVHNLKHIDVKIPCGCITTITGASGSGKSTLLFDIIAKGNHFTSENEVKGCEQFNQIISVTQTSLNRSKRSNIATYMELYTPIRNIYAKQSKIQKNHLTNKDFSFNSPGGRCETCEGMGTVTNNLLFFTNNETLCPSCHGRRFNSEVLSITYQDLAIDEVLHLSIEEALSFFKNHPKIINTLQLLQDVGLGYLELGQSLTTLSQGEGQRLKLARELIGNLSSKNLYLLDEPTSGLHPKDIEHFIVLLERLTNQGSTVIVIEHNQQMILNSDYIIDLGPYGGNQGGELIFNGTPAQLLKHPTSITAKCLKETITDFS